MIDRREAGPEVIVVGAGPVGLLLAGELALGGARVVVVDRLAEPVTESRASTLHARTMELFDQRGLLSRLDGPLPQDRMGHFGGIPLDLGFLDSRYPGQWKLPQPQVERLLAGWATELGVSVRRGHELIGLTVGHDEVRAALATPSGPAKLTSAFLVGCDGERSTVRRLAGIDCVGHDAAHQMLRADVAGIEVPNRRFERLPAGFAVAARRPDGLTRVMVSRFGATPAPGTSAPSFTELCRAWLQVTGEDIGAGTPVWLNAFGDANRLADRYRKGPVFLAGDAAHQQMPAGGQAINLGLQDAANLGWKLAARVRGDADDALLDSYHHERHAVGRRVLDNIAAQALLLLADHAIDPVREILAELLEHPGVRDRLAGVISGLDIRYVMDGPTGPRHGGGCADGSRPYSADAGLLGRRMPHVELSTPNRATSSTRLLRGGRGVLLAVPAHPEAGAEVTTDRGAALCTVALGWRDRVDAVVADVVSAGPGVAPLSEPAGPDAVLVRPDGYVAWTGGPGADPRPALRRWFGRPTG